LAPGKLSVHLKGKSRLFEVLLEVLAAALVLQPVDVVAVGHDLDEGQQEDLEMAPRLSAQRHSS
jgi:hypothetical protein